MILEILQIIGSLGIFLFGMRVMSEAIQKTAGEKFQNLLNAMTYNRFTSVLTGFSITAIIQSSSVTTVILVSLVNAGLMSLEKSIGVIMGANIGTTFTAWIVSIIGFQFKISYFAMPAIAISLLFLFNKKEKMRNIGEIFVGFGLLFLGLEMMKSAVPDIKSNIEVLSFIRSLTENGYLSVLLFIGIGALLTMIIQSSSAAMAITLTMAFKGWIGFDIAAAIVLGENIGTTITANFAAIGMNSSAKRAARAHTLFNLIGVLWMLIFFYPFTQLVDAIIPGTVTDNLAMTYHLSAFHSLFNITNTLLLVWFIPQINKVVEWLVPMKETEINRQYKLHYANTTYPDFAEVNLGLAKKEIGSLIALTYNMLLLFLNSIKLDKKEILQLEDKAEETNEQVEIMSDEISRFLAKCRTEIIDEKDSFVINSLLIIVSELKSVGNSCESLFGLLKKKEKKKLRFHKNAKNEIEDYTIEVLDFLKYNLDYLNESLKTHNMDLALRMEDAINQKRDRLKKLSQNKMIKGGDIQAELIYMDIIKHLEHIGDFNLNISHSLRSL